MVFGIKHSNMCWYCHLDDKEIPTKLITFKAKDEIDASNKIKDIEFCKKIGLSDWLFEPYQLVRLR